MTLYLNFNSIILILLNFRNPIKDNDPEHNLLGRPLKQLFNEEKCNKVIGLCILIMFNISLASANDYLRDHSMENIKPETYKTIKSENGVIVIIRINDIEVRHKGTRSEMVRYNVSIESKVYGEPQDLSSVAHYGGATLTVGEKYLVFLTDVRLFSPSLFVEESVFLDCDECSEAIKLCKENIERF